MYEYPIKVFIFVYSSSSSKAKRLQEYQMRAAAVGRELDLVKTQCKQQEGKIQQLQELLANREQEHR